MAKSSNFTILSEKDKAKEVFLCKITKTNAHPQKNKNRERCSRFLFFQGLPKQALVFCFIQKKSDFFLLEGD